MNYYNEFDPNAAAWLRELIERKLIPAGEVDERSISHVSPSDIRFFTQCHFFAGIGGWSLALQIAGWPTTRPVWTGSCPCQPFSVAGKGEGVNDPRHLWPAFRELIRQCDPPVVFGEQVASKDGREWLSGVFLDLEGMAYRRAGADLCAAGVCSPHIRQRLYWVADSQHEQRQGLLSAPGNDPGSQGGGEAAEPPRHCPPHGLGHAHHARPQGHDGHESHGDQPGRFDPEPSGSTRETSGLAGWADYNPILCRDGKHRRIPTEPALFPLADGIPYKLARRGSVRPALLKGSGNAIVPQVAAEFIAAYMDITPPQK